MVKPALKNCAAVLLLLAVLPVFGQSSGGTVNGWFDAAEFLYNNSNANPIDADFYILQYDSGYYWLDDTGAAQPFNTFAAGHIFDLKHELWSAVPYPPANPILPFVSRDPFVWDSLRFNYFYLRGSADTSIVDTLFIYYYCNFDNQDTQITTYLYVFGTTDSMRMASPQPFNYNELAGKYFKKDTVLLRHGDSTGIKSRRLYKASVNRAFNGSAQTGINHANLFGYSLAFKPGSTNALGDTLFDRRNGVAKANVFGVYYIKLPEPGPSTGDPVRIITKYFADNSLWLDKNNRYGGAFNGKTGFIPNLLFDNPSFFYGAAFVTGTTTVEAKKIGSDTLKLFPNPVFAGELFTIETGNQLPRQAIIIITDMLGRQVFNSSIPPGTNNYRIAAPLAEGVYTINIITMDNSSAYSTQLMVINR